MIDIILYIIAVVFANYMLYITSNPASPVFLILANSFYVTVMSMVLVIAIMSWIRNRKQNKE